MKKYNNNIDLNKMPKGKLLHGTSLEWRVNTPGFLKEVFDNYPGNGGIFIVPANVFRLLLLEVAERASQLNDPIMNALMCRLALYGCADPYDTENYDHDLMTKTLNHPDYIKYKAKK